MFNELFWMAAADAAQDTGKRQMTSVEAVVYFLIFVGIVALFVLRKKQNLSHGDRIIYCSEFMHLDGLAISAHAPCWVGFTAKEVLIEVTGQQFALSMDSVTNISMEIFSQTYTQAVSTSSRVLFNEDNSSAWNLGWTRDVDVETKTPCLVISYLKGTDLYQMVFDASGYPAAAKKFVRKSRRYYVAHIYQKRI